MKSIISNIDESIEEIKESDYSIEDYSQSKTCYIDIPVKNGSDYDPFITLRVTNADDKIF